MSGKTKTTAAVVPPPPTAPSAWPPLPPLQYTLTTETLLPGQIVTIPHFFTAKECAALISFSTRLPLAGPRPPARGEATRTHWRWHGGGAHEAALLSNMWARLAPILDPLADDVHGAARAGLHATVRVYRYAPGEAFGRHYDDATICPRTGLRSGWTLLAYLSGAEDGVVGGQTVFYPERASKRAPAPAPVAADLARGTVLLHRHGRSCMAHEAMPVLEGTKWVLRTDLLFDVPESNDTE